MTAETQRDVSLVAGIIVGPLAMLTNLTTSFTLVPWACANHWTPALYVMNAAFLLITIGAGWLAFKWWRQLGAHWPEDAPGAEARARFMAVMGVVISAISALQIVGMMMSTAIMGVCA